MIKGEQEFLVICCALMITCSVFVFILHNYLVLNNVLIFLITKRPNLSLNVL